MTVGALSSLLPEEDGTLLLRACLSGSDSAWEAWRARAGDVASALGRDRRLARLAPLLEHGLRGAQVPADERTLLRAAAVRERLRTETFDRVAGEAIAALRDAGIVPLVTSGAAVAATAYPAAGLRHAHDLDLVVDEPELVDARAALTRELETPGSDATVTHPSGVEVKLHLGFLADRRFELPLGDLRSRAVPAVLGGVEARALEPTDMLLWICAHAACQARPGALVWAADAWFVMSRHAPLDWGELVATAAASRLALPVQVMLGYLAGSLEAAVPATALAGLAEAAGASDRLSRELALSLAWQARLRGRRWEPRRRRDALAVARWALLPSPGYLRATGRARHPLALPLAYLARPVRHAARRRGAAA